MFHSGVKSKWAQNGERNYSTQHSRRYRTPEGTLKRNGKITISLWSQLQEAPGFITIWLVNKYAENKAVTTKWAITKP